MVMHHFAALTFIFHFRVHSPTAFKAGFSFSAQDSSDEPVKKMVKSSADSCQISFEEPWWTSFMYISQKSGTRTDLCERL